MIQQPNLTIISKNQVENLYENTNCSQVWNLSSLVSEIDMTLSDERSARSISNISNDGELEDIKRNTIMYVYNQGPIVLPCDEITIDSQQKHSGRQVIHEGENIVIENINHDEI
jgi:hypothetical protein